MIKSNFGDISIKGEKVLIMTDLECLLNCLYRENILTKDEILDIVKDSFKSDEQIKNELEDEDTEKEIEERANTEKDIINEFTENLKNELSNKKEQNKKVRNIKVIKIDKLDLDENDKFDELLKRLFDEIV